MYCTNCGELLDEGARFCAQCGTPTGAAEEPSDELADGLAEGSLTEPIREGDAKDAWEADMESTLRMPAAPTDAASEQAEQSPQVVQATVIPHAQSAYVAQGTRGAGGSNAGRRLSPLGIAGIAIVILAILIAAFFIFTRVLAPEPSSSQGASATAPAAASATASTSSASAAAPSGSATASDTSASSSAEAGAQDGASSASSGASSAVDASGLTAAEQQALSDAQASGKQILQGTVHVTTYADRAREVNMPTNDFAGNRDPLYLLMLDGPTSVTARYSGGDNKTGARDITTFRLNMGDTAYLSTLDGKHAVIAIDADPNTSNRYWPSDVGGVLFDVGGSFTIISPQSTPKTTAQPTSGDYILADSASRAYSASELEALDVHTLFLARNEIFARHGCGFRTQELRDWFGSKSWYTETIPAGSYGTEILSDVEQQNVIAMRSIEEARNSPYL